LVLSHSPSHVQDGRTPLFTASLEGHSNIVEELLRREADPNHQAKVRIHIVSNFSCKIESITTKLTMQFVPGKYFISSIIMLAMDIPKLLIV